MFVGDFRPLDGIDVRGGRTNVAPGDELFDFVCVTFNMRGDRAVCFVSYPTFYPQDVCHLPRLHAEKYALDMTSDAQTDCHCAAV